MLTLFLCAQIIVFIIADHWFSAQIMQQCRLMLFICVKVLINVTQLSSGMLILDLQTSFKHIKFF